MINSKEVHGYIKAIGIQFFMYVLDIDEDEVKALFNSVVELNEEKEKFFFELCDQIGELRKRYFERENINFDLYKILKEHLVDDQYHIMNVWRTQVSKVIEPPIVEDSILQKLLKLGTEVYPSTLIKDPFFSDEIIFVTFIHSHFLTTEVTEELMKSEAIRNLYHECNIDDCKTFLHFCSSAGSGGVIDPDSLVQYVLSNAVYLMRMNGKNNINAYYDAIITVYNMVLECLVNKKIKVPYYIGFSNINLEDVKEIDFGDLKIKTFDDELLSILPKDARMGKQSVNGKTLINGFVLVGKYDYTINVASNSDIDFPMLDESRREINAAVEKVKLSISLSQNRESPVSVVQKWTMKFAPFSHGHGCSYISNRITPTSMYRINNEEQVDNLKHWFEKIDSIDYKKIEIAVNRTVNAISQRNDPVDGFLDGIIAIENIFGTSSELSYRISMAVAFLLGNTPEERGKIQKEVNDLYNKRSKYVHGSILLEWNDAIKYRDQTINLLLECLRKLFENPKYLECANKNRAKQIMLNS